MAAAKPQTRFMPRYKWEEEAKKERNEGEREREKGRWRRIKWGRGEVGEPCEASLESQLKTIFSTTTKKSGKNKKAYVESARLNAILCTYFSYTSLNIYRICNQIVLKFLRQVRILLSKIRFKF